MEDYLKLFFFFLVLMKRISLYLQNKIKASIDVILSLYTVIKSQKKITLESNVLSYKVYRFYCILHNFSVY